MPVRLVVGLGNPGPEYEHTRHNVGFRTVARLVRALDAWGPARACDAEVYEASEPGLRWVLLRPLTYMNLSGRAVRCMVQRLRASTEELMVIYDDMALSVGQIRLRARGSSGGHKGMQSVIDELGTLEIPRLRIGVGQPPPDRSWVDHVLQAPPPREADQLAQAEALAVEAVQHWARHGIQSAMSQFNRR